MSDLKTTAQAFSTALNQLVSATDAYGAALLAVGREAGNPTARGLNAKQVRQRIQAEIIARLSPRPVQGKPEPILQLDGAPEARRFVTAKPLPGLV